MAVVIVVCGVVLVVDITAAANATKFFQVEFHSKYNKLVDVLGQSVWNIANTVAGLMCREG